MELPEAAQQLASIKDRLVELDILLNKSLEKINLHPELNSSLLTYANYLRNNKYRKLEAQSKAVLFADITLPHILNCLHFKNRHH
ncbi:uncharacterized protein DC041_0008955 [Schistosoma bovis]|uniref:Uncharacterized protein n=1 Tax=Schistosoma bovis TaxID=6184 RepID=A0A430QAS4_SCHBO|nr:uncharacterized protein DC041_0008955 [Schistosoma bovis]